MSVTDQEAALAHLNPAQREAVLTTEGPLLVIAGAGSGKTRVLTHRVAHLIRACGVKPNEVLAITFTNRAAARNAAPPRGADGRDGARDLDPHLPLRLRPDPPGEAPRLGYKSTFTIYDSADQLRVVKACLEELERDPKRFAPRGIHTQISNAKNQLVSPEEYLRARLLVLRPDRRGGLRPLPAQALRLERRRLRRHALPLRARAAGVPRGPGALAEGVPLHPRRRVPGHEPRAVRAPAPARRAPPQRLRGRRPRSVDLRLPRRRHRQHPRLREGLPRHEGDPARAELPLDEQHPRRVERGDPQQPRAQGEEPLVRARRGRSGARARGRGRARGGAPRRRRGRRPDRGRLVGARDRGLLPHERPVAECWRTCSSARTSPTR